MPDILTGEEEVEIAEAISALEGAISRLNPIGDAGTIADLQVKIDALSETIENEIPTAMLCPSCNDPAILPPNHCPQSGHELGLNGQAKVQPAYLPIGEKA